MAIRRCPGQDRRFWGPDAAVEAPCPYCERALEFWKDEPARRCPGCGRTVANPKFDAGCAAWCRYAEACLGTGPAAAGVRGLVDALAREVRAHFGEDRRRFEHALAVLDHADAILEDEGGDPLVVRAAALLHEVGIREAERKHGSAAPRYQTEEGPPIARTILERLGVSAEQIDHVCRIVGAHHLPEGVPTPEFRIVWDADRIANIPEECAGLDAEAARHRLERLCRTPTGRRLALEALDRFLAERGATEG